MKRFISSLCALSILFACTQEEPAPIRVESIELDSEELELIEGNSISLVATILPKDAENQNVIWSSSNKAVASVKDGEVTAVSVGEATITAKSEDGGKKATCVVTVNPKHIPVSAVSLDKKEVEMNPDDKVMLTATIAPENASNKSVLWSSSDESVATVKDGEVTALKVGEAMITATSEDGGKKTTCKVVVNAKHIPVSSVALDKEEVSLIIENKVTLMATVTPDNASNKTIVWISSDESVATVKDGEITALKVGEATITATSEDGGKKATCKVTVNAKPVPVTGVSLNKQNARVFINNELTLTATITPEDATNKTLIWTTSNASVATVKNGIVKGISVGEANIAVKTEDGNYSATCKVSVTEESQTQTKGPMTLDLGTVTSTTATFNGFLDIDMLGDYDMNAGGVGFIYAPADQPLNIVTSTKVQISEVDAQGKFTHTLTGLKYNSEYHYAIFVYKNTICQYGETQVFETVPIDIELSVKDITQTRATISGRLTLPENDKELEVGVLYSTESDPTIATEGAKKIVVIDIIEADGGFSHRAEGLLFETSHYYRYYVKQGDVYTYGSAENFKTDEVPINLSVSGTTQLTATFIGKVELTETGVIEVGVLYSTEGNPTVGGSGVIKKKITPDSSGNISFKLGGLQYAVTYLYCYYLYHNGQYTYGTTQTFTTSPVSINLSVGSITQTTAQFSGKIGQLTEDNTIKVGVLYTMGTDLNATNSDVTQCRITPDESGNLSFKATNLHYNRTYRFCYYTYQNGQYTYGPTQTFKTAPFEFDLSISSVSMTSVTVNGTVVLTEKGAIEVGVIYYDGYGNSLQTHASALGDWKLALDSMGKFSSTITGLRNNKNYYLRFYTYQNGVYRYDGNSHRIRTSFGEILGVDVTQTTATFNGKINRTNEESNRFAVGIKYSTDSDLTKEDVSEEYFYQLCNLLCTVTGLQHGTTYYYCYFVHDKEKDEITYGNTQTLTTTPVDNINLSVDSVTQTTATFSGNVELTEKNQITVGVLYSTGNYLAYGASGVMNQVLTPDDSGAVSFKVEGLQYGTSYNYRYYIYQKGKYIYGTVQNFTTTSPSMTLNVDSVTQTTATFGGNVDLTEDDVIETGVLYSTGSNLINGASGVTKQLLTPNDSGLLSFKAEGLQHDTAYNYRYYVCQNGKYAYGPSQSFRTQPVTMTLSVDSVTQTTATFGGNVEFTEDGVMEVGVLYSTGNSLTNGASGVTKQVFTPDSSGAVSFKAEDLQNSATYNYRYYVCQNGKYKYGPLQNFKTQSVTVNLFVDSVTQTSVVLKGNVELTEDGVVEVGVLYSTGSNLTNGASGVMKQVLTPDDSGVVSFKAERLMFASVYNYRYYILQNGIYTYGTSQTFATLDVESALSLTDGGSANCYIVSQSGVYRIKTVKGNSDAFVGSVTSAAVLWESFGTSTAPNVGQLISKVKYKDGYIGFQIPDEYMEGNAVVAVKDADGMILWSWHIWLTDQPQGQVYKNNAGTMMDRNLGATSATPGDVGAFGLLYQWGRKDPFLGSSGGTLEAKSTITYSSPDPVKSDAATGTIEYAVANPTTLIIYNDKNYDWYYTGSRQTDNSRWTTSESKKSIYDPCPVGWRVPDGGDNGVWVKALGSSSSYNGTYDITNEGINFYGKFGYISTIWYPASGYLTGNFLGIGNVGDSGFYWSASPCNNDGRSAYCLYINCNGFVNPSYSGGRASGASVRCIRE